MHTDDGGALVQHEDAARPTAGTRGRLARRVAGWPGLWVPFAVYCVSWTLPNVLARRDIARARTSTWNRDDTSRVVA